MPLQKLKSDMTPGNYSQLELMETFILKQGVIYIPNTYHRQIYEFIPHKKFKRRWYLK